MTTRTAPDLRSRIKCQSAARMTYCKIRWHH